MEKFHSSYFSSMEGRIMKTYNFFKFFYAIGILILLTGLISPVMAGKTTPNKIIGGTLGCDAFYTTDMTSINRSLWKFTNFNDSPIYVDRIRIYESDGSLFRDYKWNGSSFSDDLGSGIPLPSDLLDTINSFDNEITSRQQVFYSSVHLDSSNILPGSGHVIVMLDWSANTAVYPLAGKVIRVFSVPDSLARTGFACRLTHTVYGK